MHKCNNCGCKFEEPIELNTTYEAFYGVGSLFSYHTPLTLNLCPNCKSEDIEIVEESEDEENN